jgi:hypothetical protein
MPVQAQVNPVFWVHPSPLTGGLIFSINDHEHGWRHHLVPPQVVLRLLLSGSCVLTPAEDIPSPSAH